MRVERDSHRRRRVVGRLSDLELVLMMFANLNLGAGIGAVFHHWWKDVWWFIPVGVVSYLAVGILWSEREETK